MGVKPSTRIGAIILALILLCAVLFLNGQPQQALFYMGMNYIYDMQVRSSATVTLIQNLFSLLGQTTIVLGVFLALSQLVLAYRRKMVILVHLTCLLVGQFFIAIFKSVMKEPRPFWVESQIGSWDWICPVDFGSPSGHSFFIFAMYEPILSDILGTGKGVQLVLLVLIAVAVMASRMYLGAHSLNEVIFGAVLGCVYLVIYHYKLQQFFYQVIADILNKRHRLFYFIGNTIACLSFILLSLILYQINMENKQIESNWLDNIICQHLNEQTILFGMLKGTIFGFLPIGIIYGLLLLDNHQGKDKLYLVGRWNFKDGKSRGLYCVAFAVVAIPSVVLYFAIPAVIQSVVGAYLSKALSFMWAGMCLSFVLPTLLNKFDLIVYPLALQSD